ncbi:hypothetical protein KIH74_34770 [Kineosporia sp. J2-2]|uniref:Uncharacterized protein n=1 Tax=Kineosporia corallincola TaxID=2835133 RepID=A0ABS5TTM1_9ACTN|nr:hypothetical protein [Kineosporia corallincola]MBT0774161.1 hypothetical protein [Kineosporia corallincola]
MNVHALPALDGRSPLAFLCALGILRLLNDNRHPDARLAFDPRTNEAQLTSRHHTVDEVVTDLRNVADSIATEAVVPDVPADFPPPGAAPDRLRLPRKEFRDLAEHLSQSPRAALAERWMCSLVTDLSLDEKGRGDVSLYTAHSGKQSMHTMLRAPLNFVRDNPDVLRQALIGWRRYPGVTGEYLDNQVLFDAADAQDGISRERGVPGATWLALMSYPLFLTTARGSEPSTSGWQRIRQGKSRINRLIYPLWSRPLDQTGAITLLTHPFLRDAQAGPPPRSALAASVFSVCVAERQRLPGRTFAGVLTPVRPQPERSQQRKRATTARTRPSGSPPSTGPWII